MERLALHVGSQNVSPQSGHSRMQHSAIESALNALESGEGHTDIEGLAALVDALRPGRLEGDEAAIPRVRALIDILREKEDYRRSLRDAILRSIVWRRCGLPLAELGLSMHGGVLGKLARAVGRILLPPLVDEASLSEVLGAVFHKRRDYEWITLVPVADWAAVIGVMDWKAADATKIATLRRDMLSGLSATAHRIATLGVDEELIRAQPGIADFNQPFLAQARAVEQFGQECLQYWGVLTDSAVQKLPDISAQGTSSTSTQKTPLPGIQKNSETNGTKGPDPAAAFAALKRCEEIRLDVRRFAAMHGTSVHLTQLLSLLQSLIERARSFLILFSAPAPEKRQLALVDLLDDAIAAVNKRDSLRELCASHFDLLALNVTQHAGRTGEHYAAANRSEYRGMLLAALGAGIFIPFMALAKTQIVKLHLPLLYETILVSLNYSLGFVVIHMLHFTVATKQPAMTAAHIAAAVNTRSGRLSDVPVLVELIQRVTRTQFAAILGNVGMALPLAFGISLLFKNYWGGMPIDEEKAHHLISDLNPIETLALFHAAIAGVCLFLSGLISGYYDNFTAYGRIGERLRRHRGLKWMLGEKRLLRFSNYMERNLGALVGNFIFGCLLGMMPFIGKLTNLPLDIRHIAFASANFSYGYNGTATPPAQDVILWALAGIALVGLTNLAVSFSLALWFALRSQHAHFGQSSLKVMPLLLRKILFSPFSFILPPRDVMKSAVEVGPESPTTN